MQRKNHLRLILGIILIGSLAVLLIGYFALRKPFCYRATHRPCKG